ncbi:MAG: MarR family transcriptional regulator, partial [Roseibium sp.]
MSGYDLPDFDLEKYLPYRFTALAARLSDEMAKSYKYKYGISIPEWRVLVNVGYAKDPSIRDIERRVSLEKSKVSRAAAKLEAKGLITKDVDPSDRRLLKLNLTPKGVSLL